MAIIKCKMCGGDLNITEGLTVSECEYCGSRQTIPSADNEKKMTLFNRAARLLRGCEFDKAAGIFESIVADFPEEAEAYWGLVLCKYGIEYVDDPATGKKVPTCHRSSFDSVLDDENYEQACEYNDAVARRLYREEARQIEELRKRIIEVSGKEEPYDIFISYKELDENGQRTLDSVIAQDIYRELSNSGYRVFFSRISLEDKLGVAYEPYIFAALNSAKVMIVVGTDYEHFDAVWVKNEWGRFLKLIEAGQKKVLIPVFKNIDPNDMPKELSKLAAQDMSKLGAMQDLVHGVEKMMGAKKAPVEEKGETVVIQQGGGPNVTALLKRGNMALQDRNWQEAKGFFDRVLDMDAECAEAHFGLFLSNERCSSAEQFIENSAKELKHFEYETLQAGDEDTERVKTALKDFTLQGYLSDKRIKELFYGFDFSYKSCLSYREAQYENQQLFLTDRNYIRAESFASGQFLSMLLGMKDSVLSNAKKCLDDARAADAASVNRIEAEYLQFMGHSEAEAEALYIQALAQREADYVDACTFGENANTEIKLFEAVKRFSSIKLKDYKDTAQYIELYKQKGEELKTKRLAREAAQRAEQARIAAEAAERHRIIAEKEAEQKRLTDEKKHKASMLRAKIIMILSLIAIAVGVFLYILYGRSPEARTVDDAITSFDLEAFSLDKYDEWVHLEELFTALSEKEQTSLKNTKRYNEIRKECQTLESQEVARIERLISDIPSKDDIGLTDMEQIEHVAEEYENTNENIKEKIGNANLLDDAQNTIEKIKRDSWVDCSYCGGDGRVVCDDCNGTGHAPMVYYAPNGTSWNVSRDCNTTMSCPKCGGDGGIYVEKKSTSKSGSASMTDAEVGSIVSFGKYEQDNNLDNGQEAINWLVLDARDNKVLLISEKALDCKKYNESRTSVTWKTSTIRNWLNTDFINNAFTDEERNTIATTDVVENFNIPETVIQDKVFLLSYEEVKTFFPSSTSRLAGATEYAQANGALVHDSKCYWWLRSQGASECYVTNVDAIGDVTNGGSYVDLSQYAVRPAMWLDFGLLEKLIDKV